MGLFEQFPYTNYHAVNLKWILDRMVDFETRLTTAESDIDALEGRMDTAEDDIDALEGRMDTAEDDIDKLQADVGDVTLLHTTDKSSLVAAVNENEGRLDTAEGDIDALETQIPKSLAGDSGKVLTATGAGAASWQTPIYPQYIDYDAESALDPPDPTPYIRAFVDNGCPIYLRYNSGTTTIVAPAIWYRDSSAHAMIVFNDPDGVFCKETELIASPTAGSLYQIDLMRDNGVNTWFAGVHGYGG